MTSLDLFLALSVFAFASSITPGPNNLMLLASGANFGWRRTIPHLLGVTVGFVAMVALVGLGVMKLFALFPPLSVALKVLCAAYLIYLAIKIARTKPKTSQTDATTKAQRPLTFWQAVAFQWVNPKAWAMGLTAITVYAPPSTGAAGVILVALVFGLVNLPCCSTWMMLGTQIARLLRTEWRARAFNITAATLLLISVAPMLIGGKGL